MRKNQFTNKTENRTNLHKTNKIFWSYIFLICLLGTNFAYGQEPLWKLASVQENAGNYYEAIQIRQKMATDNIDTELYIEDIASIARCYSYTTENDSTIKYCNITNNLAEKMINISDSIAEEYIQNSVWCLLRCNEYDIAKQSAKKVLHLREKIYGKKSDKYFKWLEIMSYNAYYYNDTTEMVKICEVRINDAESYFGLDSDYFRSAISSIRGFAHQLIDINPSFVITWIEPYYQKLKKAKILSTYQYEFEILLLQGNLEINNLQAASQTAHNLEEWTYDSSECTIPLDDKIRIYLKLANFDCKMGNHAKARSRIIKTDRLLNKEKCSLSLTQLVDRHIVERILRCDTIDRPLINAKWLIETSDSIINAGTEDNQLLAFFYESRAWGYEGLEDYDKAIDDIKHAIALKSIHSRHYKLSQLYIKKRDFKNAEKELLALYEDDSITELGLINIESDLMTLYWLWGKRENIIPFISKNFENLKVEIRDAFAFMNDDERETFISETLISSGALFDIYSSFSNKDIQWIDGNKIAYNLALVQKGLLLNTTKDIKNILDNAPDSLSLLKTRYTEIRKLQPMYIETSLCRNLRIKLMHYVVNHPDFLKQLDITWDKVQSKLSSNEAAIEFITILGISSDLDQINPTLCAMVLTADNDFPIFVRLGSISEIDSIYEFDEEGHKILDGIYIGNAKKQIYKLVWEPLIPYLKDINTVYYSPAEILQEINLDFIGKNDEDYNCMHYNLYRLSSTRELCNHMPIINTNNAVVYGDISYSRKKALINTNEKSKYRSTTRYGFVPLEQTAVEIDSIYNYLNVSNFKTQTFAKTNATEASFRKLSGNSPQIIHLATHGFYYTKDEAKRQLIERPNFIAFQVVGSELDRSGLALFGAQDSWSVDDLTEFLDSDKDNDGILLSSEISNLDLSNTDLAILSACETALGNVTNEGVYGLQRAFKLAGVKSIIMSIWKVDDDATQLIMADFYKYYLGGESKHNALIKAQNNLRLTPGFEDPYNWAAFILLDGLN